MKRRKFLRSGAAITTASSVGLSGCIGGDGQDSPTSTPMGTPTSTAMGSPAGSDSDWPDLQGEEVKFLTEASDQYQDIIDRAAADFQEKTGATLSPEYLSFAEQLSRISQLLQAGDPPELAFSTTGDTAQFLLEDQLAPLNTAIEAFNANWGGGLLDTQRVVSGGDDYFAPTWVNCGQNWYRDDVGVDVVPNTWEKQLEYAQQADNPDGLRGTYVLGSDMFCSNLLMFDWLYSNNARFYEWDGDTLVQIIDQGQNRERWIETLEYLDQLNDYSPATSDQDCAESINAVANEVTASTHYWGSRPKLATIRQEKEFAGNVRASLMPEGRSHDTLGLTEGFISFSGSNSEAANAFMRLLYQPEYFMDMMFLTPLHNVPPGSLPQNDTYLDRIDTDISDAWSEQDIQKTFERVRHTKNPSTETDPPNAVGWNVAFNAAVPGQMRYRALTQGEDPADVVDWGAQQFAQALEDAQS